ncbi:MAG: S41 family peptidase [Dehalococcoidia bacterium]
MLLVVIGVACRTATTTTTPSADLSATPIPSVRIPDEGSILSEAWRVIMQEYIDREKLDPRLLSDGTILGIIGSTEEVQISLPAARELVYNLDNVRGFFDTQGGDELREAYEVWAYAALEFVPDGDLTLSQLNEAAVRGLVDALGDPYTAYLTAEDILFDQADLRGSFEGIGAYVTMNDDGYLVVIAPIDNTPADIAGIRAGDIILEVDGEPTDQMSLQETILKIRGPEGTSVVLLVKHLLDDEPVIITIIRGDIPVDSVVHFMETDEIARMRIVVFTKRTPDEVAQALRQIEEEGAKALILDVRQNPGGLLAETVEATGHFLNGGLVLIEQDSSGREINWTARSGGLATDIPLVVLVNEFSASGAEVLAGALQDRERATLIGSLTFGKGSVTHLRGLSDGSGIYITFARWYTPSGRVIEGEGIEPDIEVLVTEADRAAQRDPQLEEAITFLEGLISS